MSQRYIRQLLREPVPREWAFPPEEYGRRLARLREEMSRQGIEVMLVHSVVDMCYLVGYQTLWPDAYTCLVVPLEGEPFMQIADIEVSCAVLHGPVKDFATFRWKDAAGIATHLAETLRARGMAGKRIGVQKGRIEMGNRGPLDAATYEALRERLPEATFVDATFLLFNLRVTKSPLELEVMRQAARITSAGMQAGIRATEPGRLDNEVAAAGASAMIGAGSEFFSIDPIVSAGHRSGWFHTTWKRYRIQPGDVVLLEFGGVYHRYTSPLMRTVVLGRPDDTVRRIADAVLDTLDRLYSAVRPGRTAHEVAVEASRGLQPLKGLEEELGLFRSGLFGYSIGLGFPPTWTDGPMYLVEGNERALEPGMTFHTPLSIRIPGRLVVGLSESIAVTDRGCEVLTRVPRELVVKE